MVNKVILDSNIWIGYFNKDDIHHTKSVSLVATLAATDVYVPEYVVVESLSVLKMRQSEKVANLCLDVFLHTPNIHVIPSVVFYSKSIKLFQALNDKHLSFVDMSLLALSRDYEVKTFDKKLASAIKKYSL